jgi:alkylation response protein AidB-like acyl-CoA dehydrogenase
MIDKHAAGASGQGKKPKAKPVTDVWESMGLDD